MKFSDKKSRRGFSKKSLIFSLLFLAGISSYSENFRVRKLIPIEFNEISEKILKGEILNGQKINIGKKEDSLVFKC